MAEPGGPPLNVSPGALVALRIAGQPYIVPDDATKTALARPAIATAQRVHLVGSFKLCISSSGRIQTITALKSTGVPAYDRKLIHDMREGWRYRPFLREGVPSPVCTAVTFVYAQH